MVRSLVGTMLEVGRGAPPARGVRRAPRRHGARRGRTDRSRARSVARARRLRARGIGTARGERSERSERPRERSERPEPAGRRLRGARRAANAGVDWRVMADPGSLAEPGSATAELLARGSTSTGCPATSPSSWTATAAGRRQRSLPRVEGHRAGVAAVRDTVEAAARLGLRGADPLRLLGRELEAPALRGLDADEPAQGVHAAASSRPWSTTTSASSRSAAGASSTPRWSRARARARGDRRAAAACASTSRSTTRAAARSSTPAARIVADWAAGKRADIDEETLGALPLHRRPARSRPADPHLGRAAGLELPALADRLRRDLGDADALARLPPRATCSRRSSTSRGASAASAASMRGDRSAVGVAAGRRARVSARRRPPR